MFRSMGERAARWRGQDQALLAALLHATDRCILQTRIRRLVSQGKIVVVDRWIPSSVVYQGIQGLSRQRVLQINEGVYVPDITILLTCPLSIRAERLRAGQRERRGIMFRAETLQREQRAYSNFARSANGGPIIICDGSEDQDVVCERIRRVILEQSGQLAPQCICEASSGSRAGRRDVERTKTQ